MSRVTVSIVTYNGVGKIEDCLRSLHSQTISDFDVIVIDNASTDGTIAAVTNGAPEAKRIELHENVGFGAGHNRAIAASQTPYVLVLNQDVVLQPTAFAEMLAAAESSHAAAVGPLLLRPDSAPGKQIVDTAGLIKRPWWSVFDRGTGKELSESLKRSGFLWGVSGACMLLRRAALEKIAYRKADGSLEYFDEDFFMYKEDVDLCARFKRAGEKCWYEASALGTHGRTGKHGRRSALPAYVREYSYRNHWFLLFKHMWLIAWVWTFPYEALKLMWIFVREPKTLRVIPEIVAGFPRMLKRRYVRHR